MGIESDKGYGNLKKDTISKDPPKGGQSKDITDIAEDAEVYISRLFEAATQRELNSELSEKIYYDSDVLKISIGTLRKYLNDYLFDKFPGRTQDVHSVKTSVVKEICHIYEDYMKKGISGPDESKIKPADYKDWQVKQLVRAIEEVKRLTIITVKAPANVPVKPYDPFDDDLPHEKVLNPKVQAFKLKMINSLFEELV